MYNPLKVSLENIIPLTEARDHFSQIVTEVQKDKLYVLTKGGKPAVAIVDVKYLEHITGGEAKVEEVKQEIQKAPEKVGLPEMVEHTPAPFPAKPIVSQTPPKPQPTPPLAPPKTIPSKPDYLAPKPYPSSPPPPKTTPPVKPNTTTSPLKPNAGQSYIETSIQEEPKKPAPTPPKPAPPAGGQSTSNPTIDVQVMPDSGDVDKDRKAAAASVDRTDPADKPGPAQFDGDSPKEEPDDMVID